MNQPGDFEPAAGSRSHEPLPPAPPPPPSTCLFSRSGSARARASCSLSSCRSWESNRALVTPGIHLYGPTRGPRGISTTYRRETRSIEGEKKEARGREREKLATLEAVAAARGGTYTRGAGPIFSPRFMLIGRADKDSLLDSSLSLSLFQA